MFFIFSQFDFDQFFSQLRSIRRIVTVVMRFVLRLFVNSEIVFSHSMCPSHSFPAFNIISKFVNIFLRLFQVYYRLVCVYIGFFSASKQCHPLILPFIRTLYTILCFEGLLLRKKSF